MTFDVAYREAGRTDGPVLIVSSALGTTSEMWEPQLETLGEKFRVVAYDHRGHGKSPLPKGPYTLRDLGEDVLRLLDRLSIETANFAGLSLGGMVGMWLAANAPNRIDRLALLCTFAHVPSPEMWSERADQVRAAGTASMVDASVERWFTEDFRQSHPDTVARFREILQDVPDEGYAGCCAAIETMDVASRLDEIEAPTVVIVGDADAGATPEIGQQLAREISGAQYAEVQAAHLANVERPDEVSSLLSSHFTASE